MLKTPRKWERGSLALIGITVLGAVIRFSTLGVQNFWIDEAATVALVKQNFGSMLATLPHSESNPPLYYAVAWVWARIAGTGEFGLRSLSALFGTAAVPVVYLAASRLTSRRIALFCALLAAVSPVLVWFSQEARAYALLFFLFALSLWIWAWAIQDHRARVLAGWAAVCVAALLTHYFAVFFVTAEAITLILLAPRRRPALFAVAAVGVGGASILPLALKQANQGVLKWIAQVPLRTRIEDGGREFLVGPTGRYLHYVLPLLAVLALAALFLLVWVERPAERDRAFKVAGLFLLACTIPVVLDLAGSHYVDGRNLLPLWLPLALLVATGVAGTRKHVAALFIGSALVLASLALTIAVPLDRDLQRERLTAGFGGIPFDPDTRYAARVHFSDVSRGSMVRDTARCPGGYSPATGAARLLMKSPQRGRLPSRQLADSSGWTVSAGAPGGRGGVVLVYVICVKPG